MPGLFSSVRRFAVLAIAVAAFLVVASATAFAGNIGSRGIAPSFVITLNQLPPGVSDREALEQINQVAQNAGVNLYRLQPPRDQKDQSIAFAFIGDPGKSLGGAEGVHREFNPKNGFLIKPYTEFSDYSVLGYYYAYFAPSSALSAANTLESKGFSLDYKGSGPSSASPLYDPGIIFGSGHGTIFLALFALLVASVYHSSRRYRDCIVKAIVGQKQGHAVLSEHGRAAAVYLAVTAFALLPGLPLLYGYNRLAQSEHFFFHLFSLWLIGFAVILLGQSLAFAIMSRKKVFEILKGYRPTFLIGGASLLLQVAAFLVVSLTLIFASWNIGLLNKEIAETDKWSHARDYVGFSPISHSVDQEAKAKLTELIKSEEAAGRLMLSAYDRENITRYVANKSAAEEDAERAWRIANKSPYGSASAYPVMVVNELYLQQHKVFDSSGVRVKDLPQEDNRLYALATDDYPFSESQIVDGLQKWVVSERHLSLSGLRDGTPKETLEKLPPAQVTLIRLGPGQSFFNYYDIPREVLSPVRQSSRPAMLVYSPVGMLDQSFYEAAAAGGGVFFTDPDRVKDYLDTSGLSADYRLNPPIGRELSEVREYRFSKLNLHVFILLLTAAMLFLAGAILVRIYCDANAVRHFVERISGVGFFGSHKIYLVLTALVSLLLSYSLPLFSGERDMLVHYVSSSVLCALYLLFVILMLRQNQCRLQVRILAEN